MAEIASAAVEGGRSIGRYFTVISMVPSLLFVAYVYGLVAAGALSGSFAPARALHAAENLSLRGFATLVVAALLLGLVLHPFQFSMTQLLEGYWGGRCAWGELARRRILHHRVVAQDLSREIKRADKAWRDDVEVARTTPERAAREDPSVRSRRNGLWLDSSRGDPMLASYLQAEAARAARSQYPVAARRIMPTRLGNVLRRYEDSAGQQYGLNILSIAPHLNLVAVKEHREYVDDCRKGLDLSVRICVLFALATALSVGLLIDNGPWLLLALAPYCVSYLAYRGAVTSAHAYGTALATLVDLNRFAMYDKLRIPSPPDTLTERERNRRLLELLSGDSTYLRYTTPQDSNGTT